MYLRNQFAPLSTESRLIISQTVKQTWYKFLVSRSGKLRGFHSKWKSHQSIYEFYIVDKFVILEYKNIFL